MLDWLHWGGQLILSGPDTLDSPPRQFSRPLSARPHRRRRKLEAADLAELNAFSGKAIRPLRPVRAWSGVRLKKHPQAQFLPGSGELLAERRVGRGRIVASAFRLSDRELIDWPGCDEFFNAMLLRRPPRKYVGRAPTAACCSSGPTAGSGSTPPAPPGSATSPATPASPCAEYAADVLAPTDEFGPEHRAVQTAWSPPPAGRDWRPGTTSTPWPRPPAPRSRPPPASRSPTAPSCSGSSRRTCSCWCRCNWAVFRALGRVEWAWAAAPVIALVCTGTVIRLAQLDIGFVRSQTEVAVAELQADYGRAHLTRYNALYTSLATNYAFTCDDPGGVVLPLPTVARPDEFRMSLGQEVRSLTYRRDEAPSLLGFHVGSNSTGLVHSEEMFDLGGGISLAESPDGTLPAAEPHRLEAARGRPGAEDRRRRVAGGLARHGPPCETGKRLEGWALQCPVTCPVRPRRVDPAQHRRRNQAALAARARRLADQRSPTRRRGR